MSGCFFNSLSELLQDDLLYRVILLLIVIIYSLFGAKFLAFLIKKIIKPFVSKTKTDLDDKLLAVSVSTVYKLSFLAGILLSVELFNDEVKNDSKFPPKQLVEISPYLDNIVSIAESLLFIALIIISFIILFGYINAFFDLYAQKYDSNNKPKFKHKFNLAS